MRDRVLFFGAISMAFFLELASGSPLKNHTELLLPGHEFYNSLPKDLQPHFLTFELGRGYVADIFQIAQTESRPIDDELRIVFPDSLGIPEKLIEKFEALDAPANFAENLLNFVKTEFNLDLPSIRTLILSRFICFENGVCINIEDVGALCCPF